MTRTNNDGQPNELALCMVNDGSLYRDLVGAAHMSALGADPERQSDALMNYVTMVRRFARGYARRFPDADPATWSAASQAEAVAYLVTYYAEHVAEEEAHKPASA